MKALSASFMFPTSSWIELKVLNVLLLLLLLSRFSRVRLLATLWTAASQAPLSMGFSRQEYWSGVPLPSPFECSTQCLLGVPFMLFEM